MKWLQRSRIVAKDLYKLGDLFSREVGRRLVETWPVLDLGYSAAEDSDSGRTLPQKERWTLIV